MKKLIKITDASAIYEFTQGTSTRRITIPVSKQITGELTTQDFEIVAEAEYQNWLQWLNTGSLSQPLDENGVEIL